MTTFAYQSSSYLFYVVHCTVVGCAIPVKVSVACNKPVHALVGRAHRFQPVVDSAQCFQAAHVYSLAGRYDNPMPESTLSPQSGTVNLATVRQLRKRTCLFMHFLHKQNSKKLCPENKFKYQDFA
jgi:hypothetical protein